LQVYSVTCCWLHFPHTFIHKKYQIPHQYENRFWNNRTALISRVLGSVTNRKCIVWCAVQYLPYTFIRKKYQIQHQYNRFWNNRNLHSLSPTGSLAVTRWQNLHSLLMGLRLKLITRLAICMRANYSEVFAWRIWYRNSWGDCWNAG
jgi:hypothetical protein